MEKKERIKAKQKERKRVLNEADFRQKDELAMQEAPVIADYIAKRVAPVEKKPKKAAKDDEAKDETKDETKDEAEEVEEAKEETEKPASLPASVSESQIVSTASFEPPRQLENYNAFFSEFGLTNKGRGRDLVLVLCMSAIRVCDVVRQLRTPETGGALKLIKQNKFDYDKRCLRSPAHVAVSTAGRIAKLRQLRIFDVKRVSRVVVDSSLIDVKQRTVWDIEGTAALVAELAKHAKVYLF